MLALVFTFYCHYNKDVQTNYYVGVKNGCYYLKDTLIYSEWRVYNERSRELSA